MHDLRVLLFLEASIPVYMLYIYIYDTIHMYIWYNMYIYIHIYIYIHTRYDIYIYIHR